MEEGFPAVVPSQFPLDNVLCAGFENDERLTAEGSRVAGVVGSLKDDVAPGVGNGVLVP